MHWQNKLKIGYILFWSYCSPGRFDLNRTIEGRPQNVVCHLGNDNDKEISRETYLSSEKSQEVIDELRLK